MASLKRSSLAGSELVNAGELNLKSLYPVEPRRLNALCHRGEVVRVGE